MTLALAALSLYHFWIRRTLGRSEEAGVALIFMGFTFLVLGERLALREVYDPTSIRFTFSTLDFTRFCTFAHSFKNWLVATLGDLRSCF